MRFSSLFAPLVAVLSLNAFGQQLSVADEQLIQSARTRYYNLEASGFQSLSCSVRFDFSAVPLSPLDNSDPIRKLLEATKFTLTLDTKGRPTVGYRYPVDASEDAQQGAARATNLLISLVVGVFQTWPTKGLQGPIPPFDSQIESVAATEHGYVFNLRVPGAPVRMLLDKDYLVTEIISAGGKIDEHPKYVPSADGLIFAGNDGVDDSEPQGRVEVKYEIKNSVLNGLRIPSSVHLQVNQNIDTKFSLDGCAVKKATVVHVDPPPAAKTK